MFFMVVTLETFHWPMYELNLLLSENMLSIFVTFEVSHEPMS